MTALLTLITVFSLLITIYLLFSIDEINVGVIVIQAIVILLSICGAFASYNLKAEDTNITSNQNKDSIIIKDSLLILNTNDTVRVFNINKL
nr:MAG TPA: hypothetical protein [Caudoviricetes sp.]